MTSLPPHDIVRMTLRAAVILRQMSHVLAAVAKSSTMRGRRSGMSSVEVVLRLYGQLDQDNTCERNRALIVSPSLLAMERED